MLPQEHNELLTRTAAGTPMGNLMRRYWIPALLSEEIPEPDCPPVRVPHPKREAGGVSATARDGWGCWESTVRIAALRCFSGATRNAASGAFTMAGNTTWTVTCSTRRRNRPAATSRPSSNISPIRRWKRRGSSLPIWDRATRCRCCRTTNGRNCPRIRPTSLKRSWIATTCRGLKANAIRRTCRSCTASSRATGRRQLFALDSAPAYETEETDFGVRLIATRNAGPDSQYVRVSSFVMPIACWVPARNRETHIYVPVDDEHAWRYDLGFLQDRKPTLEDWNRKSSNRPRLPQDPQPPEQLSRKTASVQATVNYTGIENFLNHDGCATEIHGADL